MTTSSYKIMKTSTIRMNFKQMDNLALESKFCQIHEVHEGSLHLIVFAYRMKVLYGLTSSDMLWQDWELKEQTQQLKPNSLFAFH